MSDDAEVRRLAGEFTRELLDLCERLRREIDYNPIRFRQMLTEHGGPETARRLLAGGQAQLGLEKLKWHGRLGESLEAHVLLPRYEPLFSDIERQTAKVRLQEHGFDTVAMRDSLDWQDRA